MMRILTANEDKIVDALNDIVRDYGLYVNFVVGDMYGKSRDFITVGTDKLDPTYFYPSDFIQRQESNTNILYPDRYCVEFRPDDDFRDVVDKLVEWCKASQLVNMTFQEYKVQVPEKIRKSEVDYINQFNTYRFDQNLPYPQQMKCFLTLKKYFSKQKSIFNKGFIKFKRSDFYDDHKSTFQNAIHYIFHKHGNEVSLSELTKMSNNTKSYMISESYYKEFKKIMKEDHPDIHYNISKVISTGNKKILTDMEKGKIVQNDITGQVCSEAQYRQALDNGFAGLQLDSVAGLNVVYSEYRKITYKEADAEIIASVYNKLANKFCNHVDNPAFLTRGGTPITACYIPSNDFIDFAALANQENLTYIFDNEGIYSRPSFEYGNIIIRSQDKHIFNRVRNQMTDNKRAELKCVPAEQIERMKHLGITIKDAQNRVDNTHTPTQSPSHER